MNKRGQIYLLVALILALVLYMLMTKTNILYEHEIVDDFETLSRNYDVEASKFMNTLLGEDKDPEQVKNEFDSFTCEFTKYAKNQNPDFSLIYIFEYGENLYIGNYLEQPILIGNEYMQRGCKKGAVYSGGVQGAGFGGLLDICGENCIQNIPTTSEIEITIGSTLYVISITTGRPEIIIVSREEKGEQRKVYTKEEFVGGKEKGAKSGSDFCSIGDNAEKYATFCSGGKVNCDSYKYLKEACDFDKNCCWNKEYKKCEQGACKK